jgi:hypothetical protein
MPELKVVIEEGGQSREISGWRKWAIAIPVLAAVALLGGVVALFVLGVVVTLGAVLLAAVPIALILVLIAYAFVRSAARRAAA